jgi:WD40 repeat protein
MKNYVLYILFFMSNAQGGQKTSPAVWHALPLDLWGIVAAYDGRMLPSDFEFPNQGSTLYGCHIAMSPNSCQAAIANIYWKKKNAADNKGEILDWDKQVSIWDIKEKKLCTSFVGDSVLFSRDGKWLLVIDDKKKKLLRYDTSDYTKNIETEWDSFHPHPIAVSADLTLLCSRGFPIKCIEKKWEALYIPNSDDSPYRDATDIHPKNLFVAHKVDSGPVVLFESASRKPQIFTLPDMDRKKAIVKYNPAYGSELLTGSQDGMLCLWDVSESSLSQEIIKPKKRWKHRLLKDRKDIELEKQISLDEMRFSGNGHFIAIADSSGLVTIRDAVTLRALERFGIKNKLIDRVYLSENGDHMITSHNEKENNNARLWERITNKQLQKWLQ